MKKRITELKKNLAAAKISKEIKEYTDISSNELAITVSKDSVVPVLTFLKEQGKFHFNQLISICGADYPQRPKRFEIIYNLLSMKNNQRLLVKVQAGYEEIIPTISEVFKNAIWYEREVWDMYGVMFADNPDLRRILTDYNFEGHPLRKDFPLTGYQEVRYDLEQKKVVYEPVTLTQDFRNFDFISPWEGTKYVLPGDEKATKEKK
jgi:NADH-quinone oxidoreductase subunit C